MQDRGLTDYEQLIVFVDDRPGHDRRYAIDATKISNELDWRPMHDAVSGIAHTVKWYLDNPEWCATVTRDSYHRQRLGLAG